jgi:hypothetical protein
MPVNGTISTVNIGRGDSKSAIARLEGKIGKSTLDRSQAKVLAAVGPEPKGMKKGQRIS